MFARLWEVTFPHNMKTLWLNTELLYKKDYQKKKKKNKEGLSIPKTLVIKIVELLDSSSSPVSDKDTFWSKTKSGLATLWSWCISYG